ncbi:hypothetical protein [Bartonella koehlerae]|uniref:hypothetical protein n=1 Tax=Bartonella koehlerae TaxID=92181 RepID=UPI0012B5E8F6|nr:hypothetical protein [Bartonella koehlerae]
MSQNNAHDQEFKARNQEIEKLTQEIEHFYGAFKRKKSIKSKEINKDGRGKY